MLRCLGHLCEKLNVAHLYANSIHTQSVIIIQHGKVIASWDNASRKLTTFSVRKSLISALYGVYSARGVIDIRRTLQGAGVDDAPDPLTSAERQATIVDLLRARSGVYHPVDFQTAFQKKLRPARDTHPGGTYWFYNNWDFNTLGSIFEQKTEHSIGANFAAEIAQPIGMQDFAGADVYYLGGPISTHPAYMFQMSTRDLARFGQLYLCGGNWSGKQVLSSDWVYRSSHSDVAGGPKPVRRYAFIMALELRKECERCHAPLAEMSDAYICVYECTFCPECTAAMAHACPNCTNELARRPKKAQPCAVCEVPA